MTTPGGRAVEKPIADLINATGNLAVCLEESPETVRRARNRWVNALCNRDFDTLRIGYRKIAGLLKDGRLARDMMRNYDDVNYALHEVLSTDSSNPNYIGMLSNLRTRLWVMGMYFPAIDEVARRQG